MKAESSKNYIILFLMGLFFTGVLLSIPIVIRYEDENAALQQKVDSASLTPRTVVEHFIIDQEASDSLSGEIHRLKQEMRKYKRFYNENAPVMSKPIAADPEPREIDFIPDTFWIDTTSLRFW